MLNNEKCKPISYLLFDNNSFILGLSNNILIDHLIMDFSEHSPAIKHYMATLER